MPQIILVPGLLNDAELWRDQLEGLRGAARPVVADITKGETLRELAQAVLDIGEERFALAGFSLGGIVAQEVMRIAPERISHLALLDTTMLPDDAARMQERQRIIALAEVPGSFLGLGERLLRSYFAEQHLENHEMIERVREMTRRLGPEVLIRQSRIDRPDGRADLVRITCPTLVLCGREDVITPPSLHLALASSIPGAWLKILPESGHLTPIEQPEAVTEELIRLLKH
nr:alpha/beta fold hydrolase [Pseudogemmobacter hezensis]